MNLSKSKYCNGIQCMKMLWLDKNKKEEKKELNENVLKTGNFVHEIAKYLFGEHVNIEFNENLNEMISNTYSTIDSYKNVVITEASFNFNNNFCSVDILKKTNNTYELYEVKSSTETKDIYIKDISYQYYVLNNLNLKVNKCCLVHLNSDYTRYGELELDKLFIIDDVTDEIIKLQDEVKENINKINEYIKQDSEPNDSIGLHCMNPYLCPFFDYCTRNLEKPNVFDVRSMKNKVKFELFNKNIYKYPDLLKQDIEPKFKQQIEFELYDLKPYINKEKIKEFLNTLDKNIYFLDFETYQQPIPLYDGVRPYMQIPFQYSLHYIENNELKHKEFLGDGVNDPRYELAKSLVNDIPLNSCTVAYNMTFEKAVIKNLSELYPDLSIHLMNIYDNMKDLMIPFNDRDYYCKDMKGSYSIKYVLPALFPDDPSLNYHNLDMVHNGSEAMSSYANMNSLNEEEKEKLRYNMLEYCKLDTYAMVKIYEKLKEVIID